LPFVYVATLWYEKFVVELAISIMCYEKFRCYIVELAISIMWYLLSRQYEDLESDAVK